MISEEIEVQNHAEDADVLQHCPLLLNRERGAKTLPRWGIAVVVILLAHGPLLFRMAQYLWKRPHYQAFPMIIAGFAWLVSMRLPLIQWPEETDFSLRKLVWLGVGALLFAASIEFVSQWICLISCLATLWASVWYFGGRSAASELRAPFLFLAMLTPLPLGLDISLIVTLQQWATAAASQGLDCTDVLHTISGVAIRTATKSYMVEEACSGIQSLFAAVYAITFLCIYCRYSWFRSLVMILLTVFWVVAANGLRVFTLVYCDARFQLPLDSGWRHEALGVFTYATALLLTLSTDQFLRFVFPVISRELIDVKVEYHEQVRRPLKDFMFGLLDRPRVVGRMAVIAPAVLVAIFFVVGGIAMARTLFFLEKKVVAPSLPSHFESNMQQFAKDSLPAEINGWKLTGFEEITRGPDDVFGGLCSSSWSYQGHGLDISISLDGCYDAWHKLAVCYGGLGWVVESSENKTSVGSLPTGEEATIWHTEYRMHRNLRHRGVVMFSCFDSHRTSVTPPPAEESVRIALRDRLRSAFRSEQTPAAAYTPPVFQIQLLLESDREIQPHEHAALLSMFQKVRSDLLGIVAGGQK